MTSHSSTSVARHPTTTILLPRLPVFLPTFRPTARDGEWTTNPSGRVRVQGRLGQRHETLLEAIARFCSKRRVMPSPDGTPETTVMDVLIDPSRLRRVLSDGGEGWYSYAQLVKLTDELRDTKIEIVTRRGDTTVTIHGSLLSSWVEYEQDALPNPLPGTGVRRRWLVRLGAAYTTLVGTDVPRYWDPRDFQRLRTGSAQALARWVWTHRTAPRGGWKLDTILRAITPNGLSPNALRHRRCEVRAAAAELAELGIILSDGDRVAYDGRLSRRPSVQQAPDGVQQAPDGVQQAPGSRAPRAAGARSSRV